MFEANTLSLSLSFFHFLSFSPSSNGICFTAVVVVVGVLAKHKFQVSQEPQTHTFTIPNTENERILHGRMHTHIHIDRRSAYTMNVCVCVYACIWILYVKYRITNTVAPSRTH